MDWTINFRGIRLELDYTRIISGLLILFILIFWIPGMISAILDVQRDYLINALAMFSILLLPLITSTMVFRPKERLEHNFILYVANIASLAFYTFISFIVIMSVNGILGMTVFTVFILLMILSFSGVINTYKSTGLVNTITLIYSLLILYIQFSNGFMR